MSIKRRLTKQRKLIYDCLVNCGFHPTAEEVYNMLINDCPSLSLATVYRNLNLLYSMGLIGRVDTSFLACRYDAKIEKHHHFICDVCSNVIDLDFDFKFDNDYFIEQNLEVNDFDLNFRGMCFKCSKVSV